MVGLGCVKISWHWATPGELGVPKGTVNQLMTTGDLGTKVDWLIFFVPLAQIFCNVKRVTYIIQSRSPSELRLLQTDTNFSDDDYDNKTCKSQWQALAKLLRVNSFIQPK